MDGMDALTARANVTTRLIRSGQSAGTDDEWLHCSVEERLEAVWLLTKLCMAWTMGDEGEPRLQRSVVRIQRGRR